MACPRCGCRMVSKVGTGRATTLICSDCGLTQKPASTVTRPNPFGQLVSALLMSLFALTAIGLMAIKDQQSPSLLDDEQIERNEARNSRSPAGRRWVVIPGIPASSLNR